MYLYYNLRAWSFSMSSILSLSKAMVAYEHCSCCRFWSELFVFGMFVRRLHAYSPCILVACNLKRSRPCWSTASSRHTWVDHSLIHLVSLHNLTFCVWGFQDRSSSMNTPMSSNSETRALSMPFVFRAGINHVMSPCTGWKTVNLVFVIYVQRELV